MALMEKSNLFISFTIFTIQVCKFCFRKKKLIHKLNNLEKIRDTNKKELINAHLFSYSFLGDYNLNKYPKYPYGAEKNEIYKKLKNFLNHNQKNN